MALLAAAMLLRKHLSSELGFSRAHRDLNIRRIGFVASEVTMHGGIAICAPIAPYDAARKEVRAMIEPPNSARSGFWPRRRKRRTRQMRARRERLWLSRPERPSG